MVKRKVIWQATPGTYYLDLAGAQAFRQARRQRAWAALVIVLIIAVVLIYLTAKM
jgi:t-SNARE complex subunit (syntaxin)